MHDQPPPDWTKSGAPLAHLLNGDITAIYNNHHQHPSDLTQNASAAPFSGKLVDLLLDPADVPSRHRRTESTQQHHVESSIPSSMGVSESQVIQLPKPPQLPKQTTKRPRIPPLLQGLHQPPPLPPAERLFPPITEGVRTEVDIGGEDKQKDDSSIAVPAAAAKPAGNPCAVAEQGEGSTKSKVRKRRKWSDEETKDLLVGVSRFGIGSWKKILQCEEFKFHGRTAVDLKDRFRVCCPGEGLKARKDARKDRTKASTKTSGLSMEKENVGQGQHTTNKSANEPSDEMATKKTGKSHQIDSTERAKMGIEEPFVRNPRRYRQNFTPQDDRNLWRGYEKHGPIWHTIRDDEDLGFADRHPTDLRDRFRIRYPQAFAKAGFKLKASTQKAIELADSNIQKMLEQSDSASKARTTDTVEHQPTVQRPTKTTTDTPVRMSEQDALAMSALKSKHTAPLPFSFGLAPSWLDDMPNTSFDPDGSASPIILNRDILQWADSNNFSTPTANSRQHINDIMNNDITPINDGFHIDPMATLKLPFMALQPPATSSMPHLSGTSSTGQRGLLLTTSPPHNTNQHPIALNTIHSSSNYLQIHSHDVPTHTSAKAASSSNHLLRTPNLPTIVFPHVPVASARNAVHNLPTPADLLSGMGSGGDVDMGIGEFGVVFGNTNGHSQAGGNSYG